MTDETKTTVLGSYYSDVPNITTAAKAIEVLNYSTNYGWTIIYSHLGGWGIASNRDGIVVGGLEEHEILDELLTQINYVKEGYDLLLKAEDENS